MTEGAPVFEAVGRVVVRVGAGACLFGYAAAAGLAVRWLAGGPAVGTVLAVAGVIGVLGGLLVMRVRNLLMEAGPFWACWALDAALTPAMFLGVPFGWLEDRYGRLFWPRTVEQAVGRVLRWLGRAGRERVRRMSPDDLGLLHFDVGLAIRNEFGLWRGNRELLAACGVTTADAASGVILAAVLARLRG